MAVQIKFYQGLPVCVSSTRDKIFADFPDTFKEEEM